MKDFPSEKFRELLESDSVTEPTRRVLKERLNSDRNYKPRFFDRAEFETLKALCRMFAPSAVVPCEFVAGEIDRRLFENGGNGWRYAEMPPDAEVYRRALRAFDRIARRLFADDFAAVVRERQVEVIKELRSGATPFEDHLSFSVELFFEELCAEFAEIFYSHPHAQEEIGYVGFADAKGWNLETNAERGMRNAESKTEYQKPKTDDQTTNSKSKIQNSKSKVVDVVVIGTGAGGAPILAKLAQTGLKVVALEAGKSFDYKNFATDEREQSKLF